MTTAASYLIALALVALLTLLANPFMFWMPDSAEMVIVLVAAVLAAVYAGFVLKEQGGDERDIYHRMVAGRAAFLTSVAVLTLALVYQGLAHAVDPWIPAALGLTILVKIAAHLWMGRP